MSRYRYFNAEMQPCQGGSPEHIFTADDQQQITIVVDPLGGEETLADDAEKLIAECRLAGFEDWRQPEVQEEFLIHDLTRHRPTMDPIAFPRQPKYGWVWTRTPVTWSVNEETGVASAAWCISMDYGNVVAFNRSGLDAYVRAVRSGVPPITP